MFQVVKKFTFTRFAFGSCSVTRKSVLTPLKNRSQSPFGEWCWLVALLSCFVAQSVFFFGVVKRDRLVVGLSLCLQYHFCTFCQGQSAKFANRILVIFCLRNCSTNRMETDGGFKYATIGFLCLEAV